jgi:hypothetical protein
MLTAVWPGDTKSGEDRSVAELQVGDLKAVQVLRLATFLSGCRTDGGRCCSLKGHHVDVAREVRSTWLGIKKQRAINVVLQR